MYNAIYRDSKPTLGIILLKKKQEIPVYELLPFLFKT